MTTATTITIILRRISLTAKRLRRDLALLEKAIGKATAKKQ